MPTEKSKPSGSGIRRLKPRTPSDYDNQIHSRTDDDDTDTSAHTTGKRRNDDRADHRSGSGPNAARKKTEAKVMKTGQAKSSSDRKPKGRDVDGAGEAAFEGEAVKKLLKAGAKYEIRRLEDLVPFPLQKDYFDDIEGENFKLFAEAIARNGLECSPQVLPKNGAGYPENTILRGHQRCRALKHNGKTEVRVLVRYDLAEADSLTIEQEFLEENRNRRQLDQFSQARIGKRLFEIMKERARGQLLSFEVEKARNHVGKLVGLGGKTLQRLWKLINTPVEVQNAHRSGKLGIVTAARVDNLPARDQEKIARRIREGEDPKTVVEEFFPTPSAGHVKPADAVASYVKSLVRGHDDLSGRIDEVRPGHVSKHVEDLKRARRLIRQLLAIAEPENVAR